MKNQNSSPSILILEDDQDQMDLLASFALDEVQKLIDDESTSDTQRSGIKNIQIIKVSNTDSLQKAVVIYKNVLLAILDCNTPDSKHTSPHDQLVKTNHRITGQHKSVDIVIKYLPNTPITITSSWDRFRIIVGNYYQDKYDLIINFVRKNDVPGIKKSIEYRLRSFLNDID